MCYIGVVGANLVISKVYNCHFWKDASLRKQAVYSGSPMKEGRPKRFVLEAISSSIIPSPQPQNRENRVENVSNQVDREHTAELVLAILHNLIRRPLGRKLCLLPALLDPHNVIHLDSCKEERLIELLNFFPNHNIFLCKAKIVLLCKNQYG